MCFVIGIDVGGSTTKIVGVGGGGRAQAALRPRGGPGGLAVRRARQIYV